MGQSENLLGTLVIGTFFNTFLYGVVCMQCFSYYDLRRPDSMALKAGVTILFLNDTFQSGVMIYLAWFYCVENYSNVFVAYHVRWPYVYIPIATVLTTSVTHLFMTNRIYCMSKQRFLAGVLVVVSLGSAVTGIVLGIKAWELTDVSEHSKLRPLVSSWLGIQVALDVVIAAFSIVWLHRQRAGTSSKTTSVVDRLIHVSFQAGVVPLFFAMAGLISFVVQPDSNLFITFVIPMGRTYTSFFLNGLNVREELKQRLVGVTDFDFVMPEDEWRRPPLRQPSIPTCLRVLPRSVPESSKAHHTRSLELKDSASTRFDPSFDGHHHYLVTSHTVE